MDGAQRHDDRLLMVFAELKSKRDRLLRELAEVDRDMDAVWRTASVELSQRQAAASSRTLNARSSHQDSGNSPLAIVGVEVATTSGPEDLGPVLVSPKTPFKVRPIPPSPETLAALAGKIHHGGREASVL